MGVVIRHTKSVCPVCCSEIEASISDNGGSIVFEKTCLEHGEFHITLSDNPGYYKDISAAYFTLMPRNLPLKIMELTLTDKCNLNCPICSVICSVGKSAQPMTIDDVSKIIHDNPGMEFILWGMEPTENSQIKEILNLLKLKKKSAYLFTNGLKFNNLNFINSLKESGLSHVYLQFDGFRKETYGILRDADLLENKLTALENLKTLNIPTTLNVTLAKNVNEDQIAPIIDYAIRNDFVRQIGFLPIIRIGKADFYREEIIPKLHEFLSIIEKETGGRMKVDNIRILQKLMYAIYRLTGFRRCFWFTLIILIRDKERDGYFTLDELVNFNRIDKVVDLYIDDVKRRRGIAKDIKLVIRLAKIFINRKTAFLIINLLRFFLKGRSLEAARRNKDILFITCTDFCDFYKMDLDMADNYCEEILAVKTREGKIIYKPTYKMVMEKTHVG